MNDDDRVTSIELSQAAMVSKVDTLTRIMTALVIAACVHIGILAQMVGGWWIVSEMRTDIAMLKFVARFDLIGRLGVAERDAARKIQILRESG